MSVDGNSGPSYDAIIVRPPSDGVEIKNCNIDNWGGTGIILEEEDDSSDNIFDDVVINTKITNVIVSNSNYGIEVSGDNHGTIIKDVVVKDNARDGIYIFESNDVTLENIVSRNNNEKGIWFEDVFTDITAIKDIVTINNGGEGLLIDSNVANVNVKLLQDIVACNNLRDIIFTDGTGTTTIEEYDGTIICSFDFIGLGNCDVPTNELTGTCGVDTSIEEEVCEISGLA